MRARTPMRLFVATLVVMAACRSPSDGPIGLDYDADHPFLIAQRVEPGAVMDALFQGRVAADAAGCLRLAGVGSATVVWPRGFTLETRSGTSRVIDGAGRTVGQIGGEFRLGGGEVPALHEGIRLAAAVRQEALRRCPGLYWIVGEIPGR